MTEREPLSRISYDGGFDQLIERVCNAYEIGAPTEYSVIGIGYEDCNVVITTVQGCFVAKMFAQKRSPEEIHRQLDIFRQMANSGVRCPELITQPTGKIARVIDKITLVLMQFVPGKTFFETGLCPNNSERGAIIEQAAKINRIDYQPPYLADSWAVQNIYAAYAQLSHILPAEDKVRIAQALKRYSKIPITDLPHAFVHGDITKANVIMTNDGLPYILDFSVANWYPRIQELSVIAANLLYDNNAPQLNERCSLIAAEYHEYNPLTKAEMQHLSDYALAATAMELLGALNEKYLNGDNSTETEHWIAVGRTGLQRALS